MAEHTTRHSKSRVGENGTAAAILRNAHRSRNVAGIVLPRRVAGRPRCGRERRRWTFRSPSRVPRPRSLTFDSPYQSELTRTLSPPKKVEFFREFRFLEYQSHETGLDQDIHATGRQ